MKGQYYVQILTVSIMCADFKDLGVCRNVSVLHLKTLGACKFLQEPYSTGRLLIYAFFLVEKALYATYSQIQVSAPLMQLIPTHLLRPSLRATSSKKASESPLQPHSPGRDPSSDFSMGPTHITRSCPLFQPLEQQHSACCAISVCSLMNQFQIF